MSVEALEQKLAELQRRVTRFEAKLASKPDQSWHEIIGAAANDDLFDEAMRLGAEWRERANKEGW